MIASVLRTIGKVAGAAGKVAAGVAATPLRTAQAFAAGAALTVSGAGALASASFGGGASAIAAGERAALGAMVEGIGHLASVPLSAATFVGLQAGLVEMGGGSGFNPMTQGSDGSYVNRGAAPQPQAK